MSSNMGVEENVFNILLQEEMQNDTFLLAGQGQKWVFKGQWLKKVIVELQNEVNNVGKKIIRSNFLCMNHLGMFK